MKKLLFFSALVIFSAAHSFATSGVRPDGPAEIIELQKQFFENIKSHNYDAIAATLSESYSGVYADGIIGREKEIEDLKSFALRDYKLSDAKVQFLSRNIAAITFRLEVKITVNGRDFFENDNILCVWGKKSRKWQLLSQAAVKARSNN